MAAVNQHLHTFVSETSRKITFVSYFFVSFTCLVHESLGKVNV